MYYAAFLAIILHYSLILIPIIAYFTPTTSNSVKLTIILYMWILLGINIYYKGCPFIQLERKLLGAPTWIGVHEYLRIFTPKPSARLINGTALVAFVTLMIMFLRHF